MAPSIGTMALIGVGVVGAVLLLRNRQPQGPPGAISMSQAKSIAQQVVQDEFVRLGREGASTIRFVGQAKLFDGTPPIFLNTPTRFEGFHWWVQVIYTSSLFSGNFGVVVQMGSDGSGPRQWSGSMSDFF